MVSPLVSLFTAFFSFSNLNSEKEWGFWHLLPKKLYSVDVKNPQHAPGALGEWVETVATKTLLLRSQDLSSLSAVTPLEWEVTVCSSPLLPSPGSVSVRTRLALKGFQTLAASTDALWVWMLSFPQIRDVFCPDQTLVYLQGAESQTSAFVPPWSFICLPLSPLTVVLFAHLICFWLG